MGCGCNLLTLTGGSGSGLLGTSGLILLFLPHVFVKANICTMTCLLTMMADLLVMVSSLLGVIQKSTPEALSSHLLHP